MLKAFVSRQITRRERDLGYDLTYVRDLLDADPRAFFRFSKIMAISEYRRDLPLAASFAAKLVGTMAEDCGPCTQLVVTTHSRMLVDALGDDPESVIVGEKHDGESVFERLDGERMKVWLEKYSLSDLWSKGEIGGNRW